ncbi:MAG: hypothetical protein ACTSRK_20880, partial [Promethearchaeota archaeon]
ILIQIFIVIVNFIPNRVLFSPKTWNFVLLISVIILFFAPFIWKDLSQIWSIFGAVGSIWALILNYYSYSSEKSMKKLSVIHNDIKSIGAWISLVLSAIWFKSFGGDYIAESSRNFTIVIYTCITILTFMRTWDFLRFSKIWDIPGRGLYWLVARLKKKFPSIFSSKTLGFIFLYISKYSLAKWKLKIRFWLINLSETFKDRIRLFGRKLVEKRKLRQTKRKAKRKLRRYKIYNFFGNFIDRFPTIIAYLIIVIASPFILIGNLILNPHAFNIRSKWKNWKLKHPMSLNKSAVLKKAVTLATVALMFGSCVAWMQSNPVSMLNPPELMNFPHIAAAQFSGSWELNTSNPYLIFSDDILEYDTYKIVVDEVEIGIFPIKSPRIEIPFSTVESELVPGLHSLSITVRHENITHVIESEIEITEPAATITAEFDHISFEAHDPLAEIGWTVEDLWTENSSYEILLNTTSERNLLVQSGKIVNHLIKLNMSSYDPGIYSAALVYNDEIGGEQLVSPILVTILEEMAPIITVDSRIELDMRDIYNLEIHVCDQPDDYGTLYTFYNGTILHNETFVGSETHFAIINASILELGTNILELVIDSPSGGRVTDQVEIFVAKNLSPEVSFDMPEGPYQCGKDLEIIIQATDYEFLENSTLTLNLETIPILDNQLIRLNNSEDPNVFAYKLVIPGRLLYGDTLLLDVNLDDGHLLTHHAIGLSIIPEVEPSEETEEIPAESTSDPMQWIIVALLGSVVVGTSLTKVHKKKKWRILMGVALCGALSFFPLGLHTQRFPEEGNEIVNFTIIAQHAQNSENIGWIGGEYHIPVFDSVSVRWDSTLDGTNRIEIRRVSDNVLMDEFRGDLLVGHHEENFLLDPERINATFAYNVFEMYSVQIFTVGSIIGDVPFRASEIKYFRIIQSDVQFQFPVELGLPSGIVVTTSPDFIGAEYWFRALSAD